jgi:hypothetical protein
MAGRRQWASCACLALGGMLLVMGCGTGTASSLPAISAEVATATAVAHAPSSIPVTVISTKLSTYGANAGGGLVADPDTPVWAVTVSGSFPTSCGPYSATPHPCPSPLTSELILIDARTGAFLQGLSPAPSR